MLAGLVPINSADGVLWLVNGRAWCRRSQLNRLNTVPCGDHTDHLMDVVSGCQTASSNYERHLINNFGY
jgi:hypothetical protein